MPYAGKILKVLSISVALLAFGSPVSAIPVEWSFTSDTIFENGGTIIPNVRAFVFDADDGSNGTYSDITFQSTPGTANGSNRIYLALFPFFLSSATQLIAVTNTDPNADLTGSFAALLLFTTPLTNAGGTVDFNVSGTNFVSGEAECTIATCNIFSASALRRLISGSLVGVPVVDVPPQTNVPEPSALALFFIGLGGIAVFARRRKKA